MAAGTNTVDPFHSFSNETILIIRGADRRHLYVKARSAVTLPAMAFVRWKAAKVSYMPKFEYLTK